MSRQITTNFNEAELACRHCGRMWFTDAAVQHLQKLRDDYGKPMHITSGYRCPEHNDAVSGTGLNGPHTQVEDENITVDVAVRGGNALRLVVCAALLGWVGVGANQKGAERFVHLDRLSQTETRPRPWFWTY